MKRCPDCNVIYEDNLDVCPTCGERLEPYTNTNQSHNQSPQFFAHEAQGYFSGQENGEGNANPYVFEERSGSNILINGAVAEVSTQQYYQSKFTKFFQALFSGEPYQLSHTSFVTIFRVEEHTAIGYPENARDITLYGNMQNIFAVGDDVTVTARRKGNRLVARNVYNHSINSNVRIQPNIPAVVIQLFTLIVCIALILAVHAIVTADYAAMGNALSNVVTSLISALLPVVVGVWILWYLVKSFFSK